MVESIENGIASSCSLMVPCPAAADAMRLLRERPHIPFGIHLALIRDLPEYRWGPSADKAEVPSLLDPDTNELYVDTPAQRAQAGKSSGKRFSSVESTLAQRSGFGRADDGNLLAERRRPAPVRRFLPGTRRADLEPPD